MKVIVFVKATKDSEAGVMPGEQLLTEMGKFNEELVKAGIMLAGEGLKPSSKGARVLFSGKNRSVTDGPFAETKELVAGFWIWQVKSLDEAIEWVKRCPNPMNEDSVIEIRPVFEAADFGEAFTPELREQEASLRAQSLGLGALRFEDGRELHVVGIKESYTAQSRVNIPSQWERFAPQIGKVPGQIGMTTYGVCLNPTADCGFDYLCGVEISNSSATPAGLTDVHISPQRYVVFTHTGNVTSFPQTIDKIWSKWVPESGLQTIPAPCFERYTEEFNPQTGFGGIELWIPIKA